MKGVSTRFHVRTGKAGVRTNPKADGGTAVYAGIGNGDTR